MILSYDLSFWNKNILFFNLLLLLFMYLIKFEENKKPFLLQRKPPYEMICNFFTLQKCKVNVSEIEGTSCRKMRI